MSRYPSYPREVNDLLDFARHTRRLQREYPEDVNAPDILQHVSDFASDWGWDLLDLVLDHEEHIEGFWVKWKRWRNRREFIKRIARPNATFVGYGLPPKSMKKKRASAVGEPKIEMVRQVTIEHGLTFAQSWYEGEGDIVDACTDTGVMTWPGGGEEQKAAHFRFLDLEEEICANVFAVTKRQIAEAFVRAANVVLDRERRK